MKHNKKYLVFYIFFLSVSCKTSNTINAERTKWQYNSWKQQFKDYTLCQCLLKGYEEKQIVGRIKELDRSFSSPINYAIFDSTVNIILKPVIFKLKKDSTKSIGTISENGAGKNIFSECMKYYKSNTLDSITNLEEKRWKQIRSIDSLIDKKVPAF